ncbi:hypothetical protein CRUP_014932, partial [Coryphaenoides rupestris]
IAVTTNQHLIVHDLLLLGSQVNTTDHWGRSPLHVCAEKGLTPLHMAVNSYNRLVRELRDLSTTCSLVAMELARRKRQYVDCVKTLLLMGARGNTALHAVCSGACHHGVMAAVVALLRKGADPSARNLENDQPVHLVPSGPIGDKVQKMMKRKKNNVIYLTAPKL